MGWQTFAPGSGREERRHVPAARIEPHLQREPVEPFSLTKRGAARDRFIVVGAYTAVTLGFLPWLADGTELGEADRLKAIRYLRADLPVLWPHVSIANQREFFAVLDEVLRRTRHEEARQNLAAFRQELASSGGGKSPN